VAVKSNEINDITYVVTLNDDWISLGRITLKMTIINTNNTIGSSITIVDNQYNSLATGQYSNLIDINNQTGDIYFSSGILQLDLYSRFLYKINSSLTSISQPYYGYNDGLVGIVSLKFNPINNYLYLIIGDNIANTRNILKI
jgi:hypothetical protein